MGMPQTECHSYTACQSRTTAQGYYNEKNADDGRKPYNADVGSVLKYAVPTCSLSLLTCLLTYLPTCLLAYLLTYILYCLLTYLTYFPYFPYLLTCLLTYLLTYILTHFPY